MVGDRPAGAGPVVEADQRGTASAGAGAGRSAAPGRPRRAGRGRPRGPRPARRVASVQGSSGRRAITLDRTGRSGVTGSRPAGWGAGAAAPPRPRAARSRPAGRARSSMSWAVYTSERRSRRSQEWNSIPACNGDRGRMSSMLDLVMTPLPVPPEFLLRSSISSWVSAASARSDGVVTAAGGAAGVVATASRAVVPVVREVGHLGLGQQLRRPRPGVRSCGPVGPSTVTAAISGRAVRDGADPGPPRRAPNPPRPGQSSGVGGGEPAQVVEAIWRPHPGQHRGRSAGRGSAARRTRRWSGQCAQLLLDPVHGDADRRPTGAHLRRVDRARVEPDGVHAGEPADGAGQVHVRHRPSPAVPLQVDQHPVGGVPSAPRPARVAPPGERGQQDLVDAGVEQSPGRW